MTKKIGKRLRCINLTPAMEARLVKLQVKYMTRHMKSIAFSDVVRRVLDRGLRDKRVLEL
jgi:hypothetical protein